MTIDDAFQVLAEHKERKGVSNATMEILSLKASHIRSFFGPSCDVRTLTLDRTTAYLDKRREDGVSDATIEKELRELRAAVRRLKVLGRLDMDPASLWPPELAHSFPGRKRWLPWDEYLQILNAIAPQWRDHFMVYCHTGIRLSELYELQPESLTGDHLHVPGVKTDLADRIIPLSPDVLEVVRRRALDAGPLFPVTSPDWDTQGAAWWKALTAACKRAGVAHTSTNDLRRTFCSWGWQRGVDMSVMLRWMGHSNSKMVTEVYAQPSREQGRREIAKMPHRRSPTSHPEPPPLVGIGGKSREENSGGSTE